MRNNEEKSQTSNWVQNTWFDGDGLTIGWSKHETNQIIATWKRCKLAGKPFYRIDADAIQCVRPIKHDCNSISTVGSCHLLQCENISVKRLILCKQSLKINWKLSSVGSHHIGNNFNFGQNFSTTSFCVAVNRVSCFVIYYDGSAREAKKNTRPNKFDESKVLNTEMRNIMRSKWAR